MTNLFLKFPSIKSFRDISYEIKTKDSNQKHQFIQTVKLHGTNASVVLDSKGNLYSQSRNRVLTLENDNANFANFVEENKEIFKKELEALILNTKASHVVVYGEWCGEGIASKVAINNLPKMFVVFAIRLVFNSSIETEDSLWLDVSRLTDKGTKPFQHPNNNIYNISDFETRLVDIDFNALQEAQKLLEGYTDEVDKKCPVAAQLGVNGHGEGNVYHTKDFKYIFKMKGDSHSKAKSKVKKLSPKELEDLDQISKLANILVSPERLQQGIDYLKEMNIDIKTSNTGQFIQWIVKDIQKEDLDLISTTGLNQKDVINNCVKLARNFYLSYLS